MGEGGRHTGGELAAFQGDGETRLVYARWRDDPGRSLFYLRDGAVNDAMRLFTRERLECPMPECGDRRLTAVRRSRRRHGFRHYAGSGGHAPEGLYHLQAKALVLRWLSEAVPEAVVREEEATTTRERRADVMATLPGGLQVAFEVQYAALTPHEWLTRHNSYRALGVVDVWLFGHVPPQLRVAPDWARSLDTDGQIRVCMSPTHQQVLASGQPLLFISPLEERVGTVWTERQVATPDGRRELQFRTTPEHEREHAHFAHEPLAACTVAPSGAFRMPILEALSAGARDFAAAVSAWEAAEQARRWAAEAQFQRDQLRRQQYEARRARAAEERRQAEAVRQRRLAAQRALWTEQWQQSTMRENVLAAFDGQIPPIFSVSLRGEGAIEADPRHWRAWLYGDLFLRHQPGDVLTLDDCCAALVAAGFVVPSRQRASLLVRDWLNHLRDKGMVRVRQSRASKEVHVVLVMDLKAAMERDRAAAEEQRGRSARDRVDMLAHRRRARRSHAVATAKDPSGSEAPYSGRSAAPPAGAQPGRPDGPDGVCDSCGQRLAAVLVPVGRHTGCPPPRSWTWDH